MATTTLQMDPARAHAFFKAEMAFTTGPVELERLLGTGEVNIVDVRAVEDYEEGHIPGAISLPPEEWQSLTSLSKDKVNVVYCYSIVCHLAKKAALVFSGRGYPVMELEGGFRSWREHELDIEH